MKIFFASECQQKKVCWLFGLKIFERTVIPNICEKNFLGGVYKIIQERDEALKFYLFGILIKKKSIPITKDCINGIVRRLDNIYYNMQVLSQVPVVHKYFTKYKNCNFDKDVILIAGGPTVRYFDYKKTGALKCGVNGIISLIDNLDYLFIEDTFIYDKNLNTEIDLYVGNNCQKFYGLLPQRRLEHLRRCGVTDIVKPIDVHRAGANVFLIEDVFRSKWAINLEVEAFGDFAGAALSALQFIVYTHPRRIFLVGNDCSDGGLAYRSERPMAADHTCKIKNYYSFKNFVRSVYPEIEIISINPVKLRGLFKDVYTESYLGDHPEVSGSSYQIIHEEEII